MCGIAGWLDHTADLKEKMDELQKMSESLKRRGPDEHGEYIRRHAALLHRRLSVIDPENGQQPMSTLYEGEKYTIVYNGELYNTAELREELKAAGFGFGTRSDTEVLLKAYCYYKEACAEKLNGIFAFAVYEENAGRLFLCRDRVGVKPLFYHTYPDGIVFGSEIKAIFHSGMIAPRVDEEGLYELFFLGPARTPGNGIFKGISELLPGEYAVYENGKLQRRRYYRLTAHPHEDNEAQTIERVRYLLTDAIERQLVSDVPMSFFLSGGLDSGIICQTASNYYNRQSDLLPTSTRPLGERYAIHTYSVEYADNRRYFTKRGFSLTPTLSILTRWCRVRNHITMRSFSITKMCSKRSIRPSRHVICPDMSTSTLPCCSSAGRSRRILPSRYRANVPTNCSAVIRGIMTMIYYLKTAFRGRGSRISAAIS